MQGEKKILKVSHVHVWPIDLAVAARCGQKEQCPGEKGVVRAGARLEHGCGGYSCLKRRFVAGAGGFKPLTANKGGGVV